MGTITLDDTGRRRADILTRLRDENLTMAQASMLPAITERHARRLARRFRADGMVSVVPGNTGWEPVSLAEAVPTAVVVPGR